MNPGDIKDIKPPLNFPANYNLLIAVLIIVVLVAVFLLIRHLRKNAFRKKPKQTARAVKSAFQIANEALEDLKLKNLPDQGKIKQYYIELSDIVRHYLENRFTIAAPEMTTEEFLAFLQESYVLSGSHKDLLKEFLSFCDMVKHAPNKHQIDQSFQSSEALIHETKLAQAMSEKAAIG